MATGVTVSHLTSIQQYLDREKLTALFELAATMEGPVETLLRGKIIATIFYEPSTRTRFSFETAALRLGAEVITSESAGQFSSAIKGETIEDTTRIIGGYADAMVIRHPEIGTAARAAAVSPVPVINAGDGAGEHPTQALLDAYTIQKEKGKIEGLHIALVGDLRYGRTVHSLIPLLALFPGVRLSLVSPEILRLPEEYRRGVTVADTTLDEVLAEADVFYVTRIQKERFSDVSQYDLVKDAYVITPELVAKMKADAIIMHPLPRVNEISPAVDSDPRAAYFRQARNGMYVRMALLAQLVGGHA